MLCLFFLTGCAESPGQWRNIGLPGPTNSSAPHMRELWIGAWIAAAVVGVLVWGLILWSVFRYRRRNDDEVPVQVRYHLPLEALYTIAPFIVIFVLFYHTVVAQNEILPDDKNVDHEVLVVAQQWSWTFNYLGADGQDPADAVHNDVFEAGTVAEPPTLWLPVDETVKFRLRSPDVIHSFWVPSWYFKMDVVPGRENTWVTTPTKLGTFPGRCAELCGVSHSRMIFHVKIVSRADYEQHLQDLADQGNTGVAKGAEYTDTVAGLETEAPTGTER